MTTNTAHIHSARKHGRQFIGAGLKKLVAGAALLFSLSASAQTEVSEYHPGVTLDGVTYCLPRTALRVTVVAEKQVFTPGELNRYAERYMRLTGVKTESEVAWSIKSITIDPYGVPDASKYYSIALRQKTGAPYVTLAADGRILAIRDEMADTELPPLPEATPAVKAENPRRYFTQEMNNSSSRSKLAELVAQEIFDIRDSYNALTRGEADNMPKDGNQLQLMLSQLQHQQDVLGSMFTGTTETSTQVYTFNIVPQTTCDHLLVARFSTQLGLVEADDLAGAPLYLNIRALESLPQHTDDPKTAAKKAKMTTGVYYNVPIRAQISITDARGKVHAKLETPLAQLGAVELLSDALFNKNAQTRVTFSPITGGIVNLLQ